MSASNFNRRTVLKGALGGVLALSTARFASAAAAAGPDITRLSDKLALIRGLGGNVIALSTKNGMLLVDSGASEHSSALLATLRELPGQGPVRTLFNTHWHAPQTGGNEALGSSGAKIIAHEKTRLWLATDHWLPEQEHFEKARPKAAQPTEAFYTRGELKVDDEQIDYGYLLEAHTAGDIFVHFRTSNVLVVGDAVAPEGDPVLDWFAGGWLGGRLDALELLMKLSNDSTKIIASTGGVLHRTQLQAEHDMLLPIFTRISELMRKGYTTQAMLDEGVHKSSTRPLIDPQKFMRDAHKSIWAHHNTLAHEIV